LSQPLRIGSSLIAVALLATVTSCRTPESLVTFVQIAAGSFTMGCTEGDPDCAASEKPAYRVRLSQSFYMAETEITDGQYTQCVEAGACRAAGYPEGWNPWHRRSDLPVVWVSWADAETFCRWLDGRLPSQAEWEFAARGGREGWRYPWGNEIPVSDEGAVRGARFFDGAAGGVAAPGTVKSFSPNAFGLYDMAGNVWEWVADVWHPSYVGAPTDGSAWLTEGDSAHRVVRGGSSFDQAASLRVSVAGKGSSESRLENIGFRCLRERSIP
jgi:formylglycine-generating enzyme required for sulfatase activity